MLPTALVVIIITRDIVQRPRMDYWIYRSSYGSIGLFAVVVLTATTRKLSTPGHAGRQMDPDKCLLPSYGAVACGVEVDSLGTTARKSNMKYIGVDLCPRHGQPTNIVIHCQTCGPARRTWWCVHNHLSLSLECSLGVHRRPQYSVVAYECIRLGA